jgi:hypothetical protein
MSARGANARPRPCRPAYGVHTVVRPVVIAAVGSVLLAGCGGNDTAAPRPPGTSTSAGSAEAPAVSPSGTKSLDLTRVLPDEYRRVCTKQAGYAPAGARACPPLIPAGRLSVMHAGPFSKSPRDRGGYLADFGSPALSELGRERIETNGGHWHYGIAWTPATTRQQVHRGIERPVGAREPSSCRWLRLRGQRVEACQVVPYEKGGGLHGGHIAYVWSHGSATLVVSLHGYENEPRVRAMTAALIAKVLG